MLSPPTGEQRTPLKRAITLAAINPYLFQDALLSSIAQKAERRYSCDQIAKSFSTNRYPVRR